MTLAEHAAAFEEHGPVRDIYVLDTTSDDWQRLLDHLRTSHHRLDFRVGGEPAPLPPRPAEIFAHNAKPDVATADLHVDLGGYQIATFFWEAGNIEFTLFPELIDTEQRYQALMAFLVELATVTGKPAILTTETTSPAGFVPGLPPTQVIPSPRSTLDGPPDLAVARGGDDQWLVPTRPSGHRPGVDRRQSDGAIARCHNAQSPTMIAASQRPCREETR